MIGIPIHNRSDTQDFYFMITATLAVAIKMIVVSYSLLNSLNS